jgi:hypothetical protein
MANCIALGCLSCLLLLTVNFEDQHEMKNLSWTVKSNKQDKHPKAIQFAISLGDVNKSIWQQIGNLV